MIVSVAGRVEQVNLKVGLPVSHEEIQIDSRPTYSLPLVRVIMLPSGVTRANPIALSTAKPKLLLMGLCPPPSV